MLADDTPRLARLTVAILTYNNDGLLADCLRSVLKQALPPGHHEILVVDNGSTPPATLPLGLGSGAIRMVRLEQNCGNIAGMNACFNLADGDWVLFIANDVRLHRGCIEGLWEGKQRIVAETTAKANTRLGLIQPVLYAPNQQVDHCGMSWRWPGYGIRRQRANFTHGYAEVPIVPATCFLALRTPFLRLGGFDETLGISHEDVDLCLRYRQERYRHYCIERATATHLMGQTIAATTPQDTLRIHYRTARVHVVKKQYRGVNRILRLIVITCLDFLHSVVEYRRPH